jgi:hypothetical protein
VEAATVIFRPFSIAFWILWIALGIVVAVDAGKYPDWAFTQAGSRKSTWQIWPIVLGVLCGFGTLIMMIIWFASKKPAVARIAAGGGSPYGYGAPPPGYGYPQPGAPPPPPGWAPPAQQGPPPGAPPPAAAPPPTWGTPPPSQPPTWGTEPPPPEPPDETEQ